jgi:hypothetical protein
MTNIYAEVAYNLYRLFELVEYDRGTDYLLSYVDLIISCWEENRRTLNQVYDFIALWETD